MQDKKPEKTFIKGLYTADTKSDATEYVLDTYRRLYPGSQRLTLNQIKSKNAQNSFYTFPGIQPNREAIYRLLRHARLGQRNCSYVLDLERSSSRHGSVADEPCFAVSRDVVECLISAGWMMWYDSDNTVAVGTDALWQYCQQDQQSDENK